MTAAAASPSAAQRTHRTVRVGARDIHLTEAGPADGTPVVMLHGGGPGATGESNYTRNIDALAAVGLRVVVPDMPGYGGSSKHLDHADPFGDLAAFTRQLVDALDLGSAHLVGNSYGGAAALRLALDRPDKVGSLLLMGPGGIGTTRALPTPGLNALLSYYSDEGPTRDKLASFIRDFLVFDGASIPDELIDLRHAASLDPEVVADPPLRRPDPGPAALRTLVRMDLSRDRRLAECQVPTLVVWGTEDKVNRPSGGPRLARTMPRCDLVMWSRTGHWAQWEQAERFNALAIEHIRRHA
ncbi:alpha/beta fold hydrolase [Janibacter sp. CX7]|uniref:alpha/beta fold hydrolase n=1 Tax=Janibacter sp. CX7 TaxID=2963431 RepID=UPI0020CF34C9|nr:alpha/beta fold hydrolase [Janibacter sp. CX7]UTT65847.1 alpha/beta fold hydrolase [Janibacter sp. CX7]